MDDKSNLLNEVAESEIKGFNESELEDIMNEIESLENEFTDGDSASKAKPAPPSPAPEAVVTAPSSPTPSPAPTPVPEIDLNVINEISSSPSFETPPMENAAPVMDSPVPSFKENVIPLASSKADDSFVGVSTPKETMSSPAVSPGTPVPTAFDMAISGQMTLEMRFKVAEQNVVLKVNEKEGLVIQLAGGAKFCIPWSDITKKAA